VGYADFIRLIQKCAVVTLVISGVTGPILIIIAQNVAIILPLNIFESELPFSYLSDYDGHGRVYAQCERHLKALTDLQLAAIVRPISQCRLFVYTALTKRRATASISKSLVSGSTWHG